MDGRAWWVACGLVCWLAGCAEQPTLTSSAPTLGLDAAMVDAGLQPRADAAVFDSAVSVCGDGVQGRGELCDDRNTASGDGCSADCRIVEPEFVCVEPGRPCVDTAVCGDRLLSPREQCDDGNVAAGDGCDASCHLESGYACRRPGAPCVAARCGDARSAGNEECDDGNAVAGDGCGADCRSENGFVCPLGAACRPTVCNDGIVEGSEQCDDHNQRPYDGCYACKREPDCMNAACVAACGDGIKFSSEACDDANTRSGDGCSSTCTLEPGFLCTTVVETPPSALTIPVVYRDLRGVDLPALPAQNIAAGHVDFQRDGTLETGIVEPLLGADKTPVFAKNDGSSGSTSDAGHFRSWYHDDMRENRLVTSALSFPRQPNGDYVYDNPSFFPLDGQGFMAEGAEPARDGGHNFHFTSELRYWFEYRGGEKLDFVGDDDVWVFVNGRLAVDLGGIHGAAAGSVTLTPDVATSLGLSAGSIYEVVVFQAERHTDQSNYKLTLRSFDNTLTTCKSVCGDAVATPDEVCDDGKNDGSYGSCLPGCQAFSAYCGDGIVQTAHGEQCDDGNRFPNDACDNACRLFRLL